MLRKFSARQVAQYAGSTAATIGDPLERLLDALGKVRGVPAKDWKDFRSQVSEEVAWLFPAARGALLRSRVVTEHAATFSAVPGVDRWRPPQTSPLDNLLVAGDWTATGWPATMEGAVRSGYLAAEALLRRRGTPARLLQPDLA